MSILNVLASVAVKDVKVGSAWYEQLFGRQGSTPMPELAEWKFLRGGWLQVYQLPERDGPRHAPAVLRQQGQDGNGDRPGRQPHCVCRSG